MNTNRSIIQTSRASRPITHGITVGQYQSLMAAIELLPARIAETLERRGNVPPSIDWDNTPAPAAHDFSDPF